MAPHEELRMQEKLNRQSRLIKEGRRKFLKALGEELPELQLMVEKLESNPSKEAIQYLYEKFHTMKGSAPIFELNGIGQLAEQLLERWDMPQPSADKHQLIEETKQLLAALVIEYEQCSKQWDMQEADVLDMPAASIGRSRLLVIDDDDVLRAYLKRRLEADGYTVMEAADVDTGKKMIREYSFDLIILDLIMSPRSGYELFEFLKDDPTFKWLPLIVLSGSSNINDKVQCFYLGADDFVTKPFHYEELSARLYSMLERNKYFEQMAFRDPLTGAYNRRFLEQYIRTELQRIVRYPSPLIVCLLDIDHFKQINDSFGHAAGDLVLQGLANLLQNHLRITDLVARFGGEEFIVVMPATTLQEGMKVIQNVLERVRTTAVARDEKQDYFVTFSAGIAEWHSDLSIPKWLQEADEAMYSSKLKGRNQISAAVPIPLDDETALSNSVYGKQLLIADDDPFVRSLLVRNLEHLFVRIWQVTDGEEALRTLETERIDVCILDVELPKLSAETLLQQWRGGGHQTADESKPDTRFILMSAKHKKAKMKRIIHPGKDASMSKPFAIVELEVIVNQMLGRLPGTLDGK
ncbi:diguanylate cyclase [Paenibacillaceae bacterium]|nr:diguanylate cyclase [Paenibacillaceae bacterium]